MKLAINKTCVGKPETKAVMCAMTSTYQNVDVSQEELADLINQGFAFCAQHKNNYRKSINFTCSDILAVDIDKDLTLDAALDHNFVKQYAAIVYTTQNHSEDFHRFRIIFELNKPITSKEEMTHAYRGIISKFGGDENCTDACRQFYGSKDCNPIVIGNTLSDDELEILINTGEEGKRNKNTDDASNPVKVTTRSIHTIDIDTMVTDKDGTTHRLIDLPPRTSIHCPVHVDNKASAFTIRSQSGVAGIHCSTCDKTYYSSSDVPLYDFDYGLTAIKQLEHEKYYLDDPHPSLDMKAPLIRRFREKYIPNIEADTPYVLVKSPKGSGKTYWLESIVKQAKQNNKSVLLIGHRRSLISSIARRLELNSYINFYYINSSGNVADKVSYNSPTKHYAICVDSLPRLLTPSLHKYDIVIIDEVEQVFSHLTSDTVKYKRNETYKYFKHYVDVSEKVYALDADLNKLTVYTICDFVKDKTKNVTVIINEHEVGKSKQDVLDLYDNKAHLQKEFIDSLKNNKKCFVCANSKSLIKALHMYIGDYFGDKKKVISITSDNSQESESQEFIRNIKKRILDYDAVLVSPSVGTGVDITFDGDAQEIDVVYGFFEARVNTHFDIDQQLSRVRHPKAVRVWVSHETFRFETDPQVIKREIIKSEKNSTILLDIEPDGTEVLYNNDGYLSLYANVKSMQRGSKNKLRNHFVKIKKYNGWEINNIEMDKKDEEACKEITKVSKELQEKERISNIISAKLITHDEHVLLMRQKDITPLIDEEIHAMRRYEIESFYCEEITEELVKKDNKGKLRRQVREYELLTTDDSELKVKGVKEHQASIHITDKKSLLERKKLYIDLLKSAGLADESGTIIINKVIQNTSLDTFIEIFKKNKVKIERIFEIGIRKDIDTKPAQQLGIIVKQLGIKWTRTMQYGKDGGKEYQYLISAQTIDELTDIVTRMKDTKITQTWHKVRDATIENRLFNPGDDQDDELRFEDIRQWMRCRGVATV